MPLEFTLRGINSALGFVALLLLLKAGGLVRDYALVLPVGLAVSFLVDAGRTELVLKNGLSAAKAARIPRTLALAATAILVGVIGAARLRLGQLGIVAIGVGLSAIAQVYVDIALRHTLYRTRSVLFVTWFQFACAAANALVAYAAEQRLVRPEHALAILAVTPALFTLALRRRLLTGALPAHDEATIPAISHPFSLTRGIAIAFRIAPTLGYTLYLAALHALAPSLEATARALYFVFGFLHIRTMARRRQAANSTQRAGVTALSAAVISVPILVFDGRARAALAFPSMAWGIALLLAFSVAATIYLDFYERFLLAR